MPDVMVNNIAVTSAMQEAGNAIASDLMDASIKKAFGPDMLGDCTPLDMDVYSNADLIKLYIAEEIDSVQAIYIAMQRAKTNE